MILSRPLPLFLLLFIIASCSQKKEGSSINDPSLIISAQKPQLTDQIKDTDITEQAVYEFLSEWRESQNSGDYQQYASYYATEFEGIKRIADHMTRYDLKNWLKDRKKMFNKPMEVSTNNVKIFMAQQPIRLVFEQGWESGTFSDYGRKEIKIKKSEQGFNIVREEMLDSKLTNIARDTMNLFNTGRLLKRFGGFIPLASHFQVGDALFSQTKPKKVQTVNQPTLSLNYFDVALKDSSGVLLDSLIGQKIIFGNTYSNYMRMYELTAFVAQSISLNEELPGINKPSSIFETRYRWIGGSSDSTDAIAGLYAERNFEEPKNGQWALITNKMPIVYEKEELGGDSYKHYAQQLPLNSFNSITEFSGNNQIFLVTSERTSECGDEYYTNIKLWEKQGQKFKLLFNLDDYPIMILDVEKDGRLDIIYNSNFEDSRIDPYLWSYQPNYKLVGQDTVFLSCGC